MASKPRPRLLRPEFFENEELVDLEQSTGLPVRLAYAGIWTRCCREGRFEWRPRRLRAALFPYEPEVDFGAVLEHLARAGFIRRYQVDGELFGFIPTWLKHQSPNHRETPSSFPPPPDGPDGDATATRGARVDDPLPSGGGALFSRDVFQVVEAEDGDVEIPQSDVNEWAEIYPDLDVPATIRQAVAWCHSKERGDRWKKRGVKTALVNWLKRDQDAVDAGDKPKARKRPKAGEIKDAPEWASRSDHEVEG